MGKAVETETLHIKRNPEGTYRLTTELLLDRDIDQVFEFFSSPHNLSRITPAWLSLRVRTRNPIHMGKGTRIRYRFRVRGVPAIWHSEITAWDPPHRFVDEQRVGPFRRWVHEHRFERVGGRTLAKDSVTYAVPGGRLVHGLLVGRELRRLFGYRHERLRAILDPN